MTHTAARPMRTAADDARLLAAIAEAVADDNYDAVARARVCKLLADAGYHPRQVDGDGLPTQPPHAAGCTWCPAPDNASTLIIGDRSSRCSGCGRAAWPAETSHVTVPGADSPYVVGCGIAWTAVATDHDATTTSEQAVPYKRPDLPYVGRWSR